MCSVWCGGIGDHVQCEVEWVTMCCVWWNRGQCVVCGGIGDHVQCVMK